MILPLFLLIAAIAAAAVPAYGTDPSWMQYHHGLQIILFSRRLQWPLLSLSLLLCLVVIGLVISGRKRAWWLIGLGPVLALFVYRFTGEPMTRFGILDNPTFVPADQATFLTNSDFVVGLYSDGQAYAYPFSALYADPIVVQPLRNKRVMILWSPYANRALATTVGREIRARELDIVSMPADAMLVYNSRHGEFINALTGLNSRGEKPISFGTPLVTWKTTWAQWLAEHPDTQVLPPARSNGMHGPVVPQFALPGLKVPPVNPKLVTLIATTMPAAIADDATSTAPLNLSCGKTAFLLFRDSAGALHAYDRRVRGDLFPKFHRKTDPKHPDVEFIDSDSASKWTGNLVAVDGPLKGEKLLPISIEEGVYWEVIKAWEPDLQLLTPPPPSAEDDLPSPVDDRTNGLATRPARRHHHAS